MDLVESISLNKENNFFESTFGKIINNSIEMGIRALLPDYIENDVINIKNTLINQGIGEAIKETINTAISLGKSAIGVISENYENIEQAETVLEKGDLINGISNVLDNVLEKIGEKNILPEKIINIIRNGKESLLNGVTKDIKKEFNIQNENITKLDNYNKKWRQAYEKQDFNGMEKNIKKINKLIENIIPIENIIKESRTIENLHSLIKNNGQNFNISLEEEEISKLLN
ncbi:MAG: hypothetical protein IJH12_01430 [Clostridia bacterium]|nr:hypothetical protein [Clostridia bacterium]